MLNSSFAFRIIRKHICWSCSSRVSLALSCLNQSFYRMVKWLVQPLPTHLSYILSTRLSQLMTVVYMLCVKPFPSFVLLLIHQSVSYPGVMCVFVLLKKTCWSGAMFAVVHKKGLWKRNFDQSSDGRKCLHPPLLCMFLCLSTLLLWSVNLCCMCVSYFLTAVLAAHVSICFFKTEM